MKQFSTNAWRYDQHNPVQVLSQLPEELFPPTVINSLAGALLERGGKAIGLSICERLVDGSTHLRVPTWTVESASSLLTGRTGKGWNHLAQQASLMIIRSSAQKEDWLSGMSGVQHSRTVHDHGRILSHAKELSGRRHPVVLQKFVAGIGLVVDIVYSPILGRPIVRISTGREQHMPNGERVFSSATSDHEGRHEVIDPVTGTFLTNRVTGTLFEGSCLTLDLVALAQELWGRVLALGITFGVQLELIIHPDAPYVWWLVQVRPSPNQVRCTDPDMGPLTQSLVTTPAIVGSFQLKEEASFTTAEATRWLYAAVTAGEMFANEKVGNYTPPKILVWDHEPDSDYRNPMMEAAFAAGAHVQLTPRVTAINTTHGNISPGGLFGNSDQSTGGGLMALPDKIHQQVVQAVQQDKQCLHVISDGLVGQIAFL